MSFFSLLSLTSFNSIWFWLLLLLIWGRHSMFVMGIPSYVLNEKSDNDDIINFYVDQAMRWFDDMPIIIALLMSTVSGTLLVLGIIYDVEIALALSILIVPQFAVGFLNYYCAKNLTRDNIGTSSKLIELKALHIKVQVLGVVVIFGAALYYTATQITLPF
ncbi:MAG: hypothetical protein ACPGRD_04270 [Planktomarina sp.]